MSGESDTEGNGDLDGQRPVDQTLSGDFKYMSRSSTSNSAMETCSTVELTAEKILKKLEADTYSESNSSIDLNDQNWHINMVGGDSCKRL